MGYVYGLALVNAYPGTVYVDGLTISGHWAADGSLGNFNDKDSYAYSQINTYDVHSYYSNDEYHIELYTTNHYLPIMIHNDDNDQREATEADEFHVIDFDVYGISYQSINQTLSPYTSQKKTIKIQESQTYNYNSFGENKYTNQDIIIVFAMSINGESYYTYDQNDPNLIYFYRNPYDENYLVASSLDKIPAYNVNNLYISIAVSGPYSGPYHYVNQMMTENETYVYNTFKDGLFGYIPTSSPTLVTAQTPPDPNMLSYIERV